MPRDAGAEGTDRILADLEKRIKHEYKLALKEADAKWQKYMKSFEAADKKESARLASGEITKQEYQNWRLRHLAQGKHWEEMRNVVASDYHNRNLIAAKLTNDTMADVYALNANYGTYLIEHGAKIDTGFTLYNHDTAEALLKKEWSVSTDRDENSFLPKPSAKKLQELEEAKRENPDVLWNKQNLQSAMMQGVLTGEPLTELAKRLAGVAQMDANQAIRNARTMTTNVQNYGRMSAFDRAANLGVELMDEWNSILDGATRHSHRHMHGERKPHNSKEPFSNGCRWPGDPQGPAAEVYNCRCRIISWVKGFEGDTVKSSPGMEGKSFEEWQNEKAPKTASKPKISDEEKQKQIENSGLIKDLRKSKIQRIEPKRYSTIPTSEEIAEKVCGGDETKGSCVSLAFAYAGNKNGLEVLDFRGGESQDYFAHSWGWSEIAKRFGEKASAKTDMLSAVEVLKKAEIGKEYILITGKHASVIRRLQENDFQYLELQEQQSSWYPIGRTTLKDRFGCRKTQRKLSWTNTPITSNSYLIDIDKLKDDSVFEEALCYINTEPEKRKMGRYGHAK